LDLLQCPILPKLGDYHVLPDFNNVFPNEVPRPPKRNSDFPIDLVLGIVPMSNTPYRMSTP